MDLDESEHILLRTPAYVLVATVNTDADFDRNTLCSCLAEAGSASPLVLSFATYSFHAVFSFDHLILSYLVCYIRSF